MKSLKYLSHYSESTQQQVHSLIEQNLLERHLLTKYPTAHTIKNDKALFAYVSELKNEYMKRTPPLNKAMYDAKINIIHNALGTHHYISKVHGNKLKASNEIKIAALFKNTPENFLRMIVVHELAHFKEKEHNKSFYQLCEYMQPNYHQVEFDLRLYLTLMDLSGKIAAWG